MMLAFGCIAAVACGSLLVHLEVRGLLPVTLVLILAGAVALARRRPAEAWTVVLAGLLACTGLVRGASVGPAGSARVAERGWSGAPALRTFEVVGASEPGPRCSIEVRDPRAGIGSPTITVSAPIEACPRSNGEQIAVLAPRLGRDWRAGTTFPSRARS